MAISLVTVGSVAAVNNTTYYVVMNGGWVSGDNAGAMRTVNFTWWDSAGNLKSKQTVKSDQWGSWNIQAERFERVESGDVISTTISQSARTFTVPKLTARIDRETDVVAGNTTPNHQVAIGLHTYAGGFASSGYSSSMNVSSTGSGAYAADFTSVADIKGFDRAEILWSNPTGDWVLRSVTAEAMQMWIRRSFVDVAGNVGADVTVQLLQPPGLLAQAGGTLGQDEGVADHAVNNRLEFTDVDGDWVRTNVGNRVVGDFAIDADLVVPNVTAAFNKMTDRVTADCGWGSGVGVQVDVYKRLVGYGADWPYRRYGFTDATAGVFVADFGVQSWQGPPFNIKRGTKVDVHCKWGSGDVVSRTFTVP